MSRPSFVQCQLGLITAEFRSNVIFRLALHQIGFDLVAFIEWTAEFFFIAWLWNLGKKNSPSENFFSARNIQQHFGWKIFEMNTFMATAVMTFLHLDKLPMLHSVCFNCYLSYIEKLNFVNIFLDNVYRIPFVPPPLFNIKINHIQTETEVKAYLINIIACVGWLEFIGVLN